MRQRCFNQISKQLHCNMKNTLLFSFTLCLMFAQLRGQETSKKWQLYDFRFQTGAFGGESRLSQTEAKSLVPTSILLSDKPDENQCCFSGPGQGMWSLQSTWRRGAINEGRVHSRWRLGLSLHSGQNFGYSQTQIESFPQDTLTNSKGQQRMLDSLSQHQNSFSYHSKSLQVEGAWLLYGKALHRWQLYTGLQFSAGFMWDNRSQVNRFSRAGLRLRDGNENFDYFPEMKDLNERTPVYENFRNARGWSAMLSLPLGVDFSLGKENRFWNRWALNLEYQLGLYGVFIPELSAQYRPVFVMRAGLRYRLA